MKRTKTYEFTRLGLAQAQLDCRLARQNKWNRIISATLLIGLGFTGVITVTLLLISLGSTAITVATEYLVD